MSHTKKILNWLENNGYKEALNSCLKLVLSDEGVKNDAENVKNIINNLKNNYQDIDVKEIMQSLGKLCIGELLIQEAKAKINENDSLEDKLKKLNELGIGGGYLRLEGKKIIGEYRTCYCSIPFSTENMPIEYCHCSAGWYKRFFEALLSRNVRVDVLTSILNNDKACKFMVTIEE